MLILAVHDPVDHVLPHSFFRLLPFNLNFGRDQIPLLSFPLSSEFHFTNHLLMTLIAAGLCLLIFPRVARAYTRGTEPGPPRSLLTNLFEALLQFIREEVARPVLKHHTDRFIAFLWTLFFFILFCNLLGMIPLGQIIQVITLGQVKHVGGTATGNLAITGGLAICAFLLIHVSGIREVYQGLIAGSYGHHNDGARSEAHDGTAMSSGRAARWAFPLYLWNFAPHVFAKHEARPKPGIVLRALMIVVYAGLISAEYTGIFGGIFRSPEVATIGAWTGLVIGVLAGFCAGGLHWTDLIDMLMWAFLLLLEFIGAIIKPFALMMRLFANMTAGHIVLASILAMIFTAKSVAMGYTVGVISSLGCVAISCLELFVAFLQAYIFVFLTTLFISMAVAPEH